MKISFEGLTVDYSDFYLSVEKSEPAPILITVPHDGLLKSSLLGLIPERQNGQRLRDQNVWPLAKDILLNSSSSGLRGMMPRILIDYNRPPERAFEKDDLKLPYQKYHQKITELLETAIDKHSRENCLLIDLHGFSSQPPYAPAEGYDLILGTNNRTTIKFGNIDQELAGFMEGLGYRIFLPREKPISQGADKYNGGFTTYHYSAHFGINTIQIEVARRFRIKEGADKGQKMALNLAEFFSQKF